MREGYEHPQQDETIQADWICVAFGDERAPNRDGDVGRKTIRPTNWIRPIAQPLSGAALAKSLGYTGDSYGVESMPPCDPGYRMVRPGEPVTGPCEYWHDGRWNKDRSTYESVMTDFAPIRVKLPTGGVVTPESVAQRILDRHPPVMVAAHIMRFGKTEHRVEACAGKVIVYPPIYSGGLDGPLWHHAIALPVVTHETPTETLRALILDHLGVERIADTAKAQDAEQQRTTRTQYGPGTLGEWEVNL